VVGVISCNARACLLPPGKSIFFSSPATGSHDAVGMIDGVPPPHDRRARELMAYATFTAAGRVSLVAPSPSPRATVSPLTRRRRREAVLRWIRNGRV